MGNEGGAGNTKVGVRILHILMKTLLGVAVTIFICAISFLILQIFGKNSLYSNADNGEMIKTLSEMTIKLGGDSGGGDGDWADGDIRYQGIHYRYNKDVLTFLFMGIDKMTEVRAVEDGFDGGQSDALFLLVLDPHQKKISVIGIPRDTMTDIEVYSKEGDYIGMARGQITLQHGYGDGAELSCERSMKAVSHLFYNLPIHGYCAINMGAIPLINDAVGGIELKALETLDFKDFHIKEGETVYLQGMDAYYYLHNRDTGSFNSAGRRLGRQKQYLTAYAGAAIEATKKDITFPVNLYSTLSKYMVTDITVDEVSYLATQVMGYSFSEEGMYSLAGITVMGEKFEEFYVDEQTLYELILKVFYEEVE